MKQMVVHFREQWTVSDTSRCRTVDDF